MDERVNGPQQERLTITARIDAAVMEAASTKRLTAVVVVVALGCVLLFDLLIFGIGVVTLVGAEQLVAPLALLGMWLAPWLLILSIARKRAPGRAFWGWLLLGGILVALGPTLALIDGNWGAETTVPGGRSSSDGPLSVAAPMLWVLALGMIVPGVLGLLSTRVRRL